MTSWKKGTTVFTVKVFTLNNRNGSKTRMCTIPSPLVKRFGECEKVRFEITDNDLVTVGPARQGGVQ